MFSNGCVWQLTQNWLLKSSQLCLSHCDCVCASVGEDSELWVPGAAGLNPDSATRFAVGLGGGDLVSFRLCFLSCRTGPVISSNSTDVLETTLT